MNSYKDMIIRMTEMTARLLKADYDDNDEFINRTCALINFLEYESTEMYREMEERYLDECAKELEI